jgi:hypothetical protein
MVFTYPAIKKSKEKDANLVYESQALGLGFFRL